MNTKIIALLSVILLLLASCDNDFEELNKNPNQSTENPSLDLLFAGIVANISNQYISSFNIQGQLAQQMVIKDSDVGTLAFDEDATSRRAWEIAYSETGGVLRNIEFLTSLATERDRKSYLAISKILKVILLSQTTDLFGDIPYEDAGQGFKVENRFLFPKYDSQQEVYNRMISELDLANTLLAGTTEEIDDVRDIYFKGDLSKWQKLANSLRLRLLMRISDVEDVSITIATIFNNPTDFPVIEMEEEEPLFSFAVAKDWPFSSIEERDRVDNIRLSATVVDILKGEGGVNKVSNVMDPRLSKWANPTENSIASGSPEFVGQPVGLENDITEKSDRSLLSEDFRELNKFWLITVAEIQFIKTEAIARGMISGNAPQTFRQGIEASLTRYGIDVATTESQSFLSDITSTFIGNEQKYIAIQRWLNQINNGLTGYTIWRRMDFPILEKGIDAVASAVIPTRYFYSSKTTDKNQTNADIAINRAPLNGINTSTQKVWWDSK